jgi:hypothetical protein
MANFVPFYFELVERPSLYLESSAIRDEPEPSNNNNAASSNCYKFDDIVAIAETEYFFL